VFFVGNKPSLIFNYSKILADSTHDQFLKFYVEGAFKHQSVLMYLLLFHQEEIFKFPLLKLDAQGRPQSIIHCNSLVRKNTEEYSFGDYVNQFLHMSLCLLSSDVIPSISLEIRRILHLTKKAKVGD